MVSFAAATLAMLLPATARADGHGHGQAPVAGVCSIDVYPDGPKVHMLIGSRQPSGPTQLHYRRSNDAGETWTEPIAVGAGMPEPDRAHRGSDVQIAAAGRRLVAVWQKKGTGKYGGGPMVTAISTDDGKSWLAGPNPSDEESTGGHGFIDIAADRSGAFHLVWLDGRSGVQGLRYARSADGGESWLKNQTLDAETCECCWNTVTTGPAGAVAVLYRDKDPRDMAIVRSADGGKTWSQPVVVGRFDWDIEACPHVGGGLALTGQGDSASAHALVWTGNPQFAGVHLLSTQGASSSWTEPKRLGSPRAWHSDLAANERGELAAAWDAHTDNGLAIFAATSSDGGKTWTEPRLLNSPGTSASHPRVIWTALGFRVFWTEHAEGHETTWAVKRL